MPPSSVNHSTSVVVIGAGSSGLAVAKLLRRRGITVRVIEKACRAGDAWYHRHPQLRLNTHRQLSSLPGLPMPKSAGPFPARDDVIGYLDEYARRLDAPIDYGVEVTSIAQSGCNWAVSTSAGVYNARHVVVATGYDRQPHLPCWKGRALFRGPLIHAANFGDLASYRGKRVLVVGAGNSGSDILNHLSTIETDRVWVSVRHGPIVFPRRLWGIPVQRLSPLFALLPTSAVDRLLQLTEFLAFGQLAKWGLPRHPLGGATRLLETGTAPAIDNGFIAALKAGRSEVVAEIESFEADRVRLIDGRFVEADIVIAATGYRTGLQPMLGHLDILGDAGEPLFHGAEQLQHCPGLWFTGMRPRLTGFFHMAGKTAREIAAAIVSRAEPDNAVVTVRKPDFTSPVQGPCERT